MTWAVPANVCLPTRASRPDAQRTNDHLSSLSRPRIVGGACPDNGVMQSSWRSSRLIKASMKYVKQRMSMRSGNVLNSADSDVGRSCAVDGTARWLPVPGNWLGEWVSLGCPVRSPFTGWASEILLRHPAWRRQRRITPCGVRAGRRRVLAHRRPPGSLFRHLRLAAAAESDRRCSGPDRAPGRG